MGQSSVGREVGKCTAIIPLLGPQSSLDVGLTQLPGPHGHRPQDSQLRVNDSPRKA